MTRKLIALAGKAQSGKGAVAKILVERYRFKEVAFADALKLACRDIFGFGYDELYGEKKYEVDPAWGKSPGQILQFVGTELFRNQFDQDIWIKALLRKIAQHPRTNFCCSDVRFPNELMALKEQGAILVVVRRPLGEKKKDARDPLHASETALDDWTDWDHVIENVGTMEDLEKKVSGIVGG